MIERSLEIRPTSKSGDKSYYSDVSLTALFNTHMASVNSERQAIWQRYNIMLLANSFIFGFVVRVENSSTVDWKFISIFGLLLCCAWIVMTIGGYKFFWDFISKSSIFRWTEFEGTSPHPLGEYIGYSWRTFDIILWPAIFVILCFMGGYIYFFYKHVISA